MKDCSSLSADDLVALQQGVPVDPSPADTDMTTTASVRNKLQSLNPAKAPGPDGIYNWLLKEYAEELAAPISNVLNASYKEQLQARSCSSLSHHVKNWVIT